MINARTPQSRQFGGALWKPPRIENPVSPAHPRPSLLTLPCPGIAMGCVFGRAVCRRQRDADEATDEATVARPRPPSPHFVAKGGGGNKTRQCPHLSPGGSRTFGDPDAPGPGCGAGGGGGPNFTVLGTNELEAVALLCEGRHGAEAALVSGGTTLPLSPEGSSPEFSLKGGGGGGVPGTQKS